MSGTLGRQQLAILSGLADRAFTADRMRLMEAVRILRDIEAELDSLHSDRHAKRSLAGTDIATAQTLAGWHVWATRQEAVLRARIAEAQAAVDAARAVAAKGFGRVRAVDHLNKDARTAAVRDAERAAERSGLPS